MLPTYGTPRRPDRETTGHLVAEVAEAHGITLKPWQRHVMDVAGEIDPETGEAAYDRVVLSVGRRAGKTLALWLRLLTDLQHVPDSVGYFTRQTQHDAVISWQSEFVPLNDRSPYDFKMYHSGGNQRITSPVQRSQIRLFSPRAHALHGAAANTVVFDEAFAHSRELGQDLEVAAGPLLWTRPNGQIWIASAAGDLDSTWWNDWLAGGRDAVAEDRGTGTCHVEWSIDGLEDELDWTSPDVWRQVHPGELPARVMQNEYDRDPEYFRRTMLNVTDTSSASKAALDQEFWRAAGVPSANRVGAVTLGVDAGPRQGSTSIVACYDAGRVVEIVQTGDGTDWVMERLLDLAERWDLYGVGVDPGAPIGMLTQQMRVEGLPVVDFSLRQVAAASAQLADAVKQAQIKYVRDPAFDLAATAARRRNVGDGAWAFSRTASPGDVTPVIAAALARACHPDVSGVGAVSIG